MGEVAVKNADRIIVTDEESYNEDPKTIRKMVLDGISRASGEAKSEEIADRRDAIAKSFSTRSQPDGTVQQVHLRHDGLAVAAQRQPRLLALGRAHIVVGHGLHLGDIGHLRSDILLGKERPACRQGCLVVSGVLPAQIGEVPEIAEGAFSGYLGFRPRF